MPFSIPAILAAVLVPRSAAAAVRHVALAPPARDFGYFLGDILTATAVITADDNTVLDRSTLPEPGPVSRLIDVRHVTVTDTRADGGHVIRIRIAYQSFYGPDAATQTEVPGYHLEFADGKHRFPVDVPSWRFTASALRHAVVAVTDASLLRPDHPPTPMPDRAARLRLRCGLAGLLIAAGLMLARCGVLPAIGAQRGPFTRLSRRMRRLLRGTAPSGGQEAALLALHRAFNTMAGRSVLAGDIETFLSFHPAFRGLRQDITDFFAASEARFFGAGTAPTAVSDEWLLALARRLARAERG
jgi:mxaA protein